GLGEFRAFGEEAIAGMDQARAAGFGRGQKRGDVQIALGGRCGPDADRLIGQVQPGGVAIRLGMRADDAPAKPAAGADDAQGDLAPVGHQQAVHVDRGHQRILISGAPASTVAPSPTMMASTVPAWGAGMAVIIFIASMTQIVWPASTRAPTSTKAVPPDSG